MKLESLVIVNQNVTVNTFSSLVHTARHTMKVYNTRSWWPNRKEGAIEGRIDDWGEVVTRYPYENVGMDHLLSREKDLCTKDFKWFYLFKKIIIYFSYVCLVFKGLLPLKIDL